MYFVYHVDCRVPFYFGLQLQELTTETFISFVDKIASDKSPAQRNIKIIYWPFWHHRNLLDLLVLLAITIDVMLSSSTGHGLEDLRVKNLCSWPRVRRYSVQFRSNRMTFYIQKIWLHLMTFENCNDCNVIGHDSCSFKTTCWNSWNAEPHTELLE